MNESFIAINGQHYPLAKVDLALFEDREYGNEENPQRLPQLEAIVREGQLFVREGEPMHPTAANRVRDRLLNPSLRERGRGPARRDDRWLFDGLWPWGTIPMLGGQPKAGKTSLVIDLVAALTDPDRDFLGRFPSRPLEWVEQRRHNPTAYWGVTVINAETPPDAFEEALRRELTGHLGRLEEEHGGRCFVSDFVDVFHLEGLGGAGIFDLTDPDIFDAWMTRLVKCDDCEGADDRLPQVVIVDGLTAILAGAGKGPEAYGLWNAQFRRLLRALDVPNGLVVAHNTMQGGHLMGGVEAQAGSDGLWTYAAANPDNPTSPRHFSVRPRLGGVAVPRSRVDLTEEGRLVMTEGQRQTPQDRAGRPNSPAPASSTDEGEEAPAATPEEPSIEELIIELVATSETPPSSRDLRQVRGDSRSIDAARERLVESGALVRRPRQGRGGGHTYHLPDTVVSP